MNRENQARPPMPMPGGRGGPNHRANVEKPKHMRRTLMRLVRYIGRSRYLLIALLALTLVIAVIELSGPMLQGSAIDAIEPVHYDAAVGKDAILFGYDAHDPRFADIDVGVRYVVHWQGGDYVGPACAMWCIGRAATMWGARAVPWGLSPC